MSHDSRYETECPHGHGWYFYEDGCAHAGCEHSPIVPEGFRYGFLEFQRRNWRTMVAFGLGMFSPLVADHWWGVALVVLATAPLFDWRLR